MSLAGYHDSSIYRRIIGSQMVYPRFRKQQWYFMYDQNIQYSQGQIQFNTISLQNSRNVNYSEAYINVPLTAKLNPYPGSFDSQAHTPIGYSPFATKGSVLSLIDSYDVILSNTNLNQKSSWQNLWNHWRLLTLLSPERVRYLTYSMFFTKDESLTSFVGGAGLVNGQYTFQSYNYQVTPALATVNDIPQYNQGLADRARVLSKRLAPYNSGVMNTSYLTYTYVWSVAGTSSVTPVGGNYLYNWQAFIPLRFINDFFNRIDFPISGAQFVINLYLNLNTNNNTCPYMFTSQAYQNAVTSTTSVTGQGVGGGAMIDQLAFIASGGLKIGTGGVTATTAACTLWYPSYEFFPGEETKYAKELSNMEVRYIEAVAQPFFNVGTSSFGAVLTPTLTGGTVACTVAVGANVLTLTTTTFPALNSNGSSVLVGGTIYLASLPAAGIMTIVKQLSTTVVVVQFQNSACQAAMIAGTGAVIATGDLKYYNPSNYVPDNSGTIDTVSPILSSGSNSGYINLSVAPGLFNIKGWLILPMIAAQYCASGLSPLKSPWASEGSTLSTPGTLLSSVNVSVDNVPIFPKNYDYDYNVYLQNMQTQSLGGTYCDDFKQSGLISQEDWMYAYRAYYWDLSRWTAINPNPATPITLQMTATNSSLYPLDLFTFIITEKVVRIDSTIGKPIDVVGLSPAIVNR